MRKEKEGPSIGRRRGNVILCITINVFVVIVIVQVPFVRPVVIVLLEERGHVLVEELE